MQYRGWKRSRWMVAGMLLAVFLVPPSIPVARAAQVLYDDFDHPSNLVLPDLWRASVLFTGSLSESLRFIDRVVLPTADPHNGKLFIGRRLVVRPGASGGGDAVRYEVTNPAGMTGIQADITMGLCIVSDGTVRAQLMVAGFGNSTIPEFPGDRRGDILGIIEIDCSADNQPEIGWHVVQCIDAGCDSPNTLQSGVFGPAGLGQRHTLRVQKVGATFEFTADGQTQTVFPGAIFVNNFPLVQIGTRIDLNTPANGGEFAVVATFDTVLVDK